MSLFDKLKYVSGAKPGKKRKILPTREELAQKHKDKSQEYEKNRPDRTFQERWKVNRPWLTYDKNTGLMKCLMCIDYYISQGHSTPSGSDNKQNIKGFTFLEGSSNLRITAVTDHEDSHAHKHAVERCTAQAQKGSSMAQSKAGKTLKILHAAHRNRLTTLFRNAHAVAKQNRPLSDFEWLCMLDKAKGIDNGETYMERRAGLSFMLSIAAAERIKTVNFLESANFFAFMMDGSTDISGDEQEAIYVRSCAKGKVIERFFDIGSPKSTRAEDLYEFCLESFSKANVNPDKLVGMGSDGASNMTGIRGGLAVLLRQRINNEMVNVHCFAHRLELAFRDVVKNNKLYEKLMTLLIGLHYFYKKQYKNKSGLLNTIAALEVKGTLPPKVTGTRWLPHLQRGIKSLFTTFRAYEAHLSTISHENPKAEGLVKIMLDKNLICFTLFLKEILEPLHTLSLKLQSHATTYADCLFWVEQTTEMLQEIKLRESDELKEVLTSGKLQSVQLKGRVPSMSYKDDMIDNLAEAAKKRFCWSETNVLNATKITNLNIWPKDEKTSEFLEFGVEEVKIFSEHYSETLTKAFSEFNTGEAVSEWRSLKRALLKRYGNDLPKKSWDSLYDQDFPSIMSVIDLMLTLPPTSVTCETTFSQMKLIKTSRRTRLQPSTLRDPLVVKLESPDVKAFNPEPAIDHWLTAKTRRLTYKGKAALPKVEDVAVIEDEEGEEEAFEVEIEDQLCSEVETVLGGSKDFDEDDSFCLDFQTEEDNLSLLFMYTRE